MVVAFFLVIYFVFRLLVWFTFVKSPVHRTVFYAVDFCFDFTLRVSSLAHFIHEIFSYIHYPPLFDADDCGLFDSHYLNLLYLLYLIKWRTCICSSSFRHFPSYYSAKILSTVSLLLTWVFFELLGYYRINSCTSIAMIAGSSRTVK